jgi:transposase
LRAGLLAGSYLPPQEVRELRDMTRYRSTILHEIVAQKNRTDKYLQMLGFKLSNVLSDSFGTSGLSIIHYLIEHGRIPAEKVREHLWGSAIKKLDQIKLALNGELSDHQREYLRMLVDWLEAQKQHLAMVEQKIEHYAERFESAIQLIDTVPGIQQMSATLIVSEIGVDLTAFKTAAHLCSWAGLSPGNYESAGKKKATRVNKGNVYLKNILCQCAWAVTRIRNNYLATWFWKIKQRRGAKRAIVALARKILSIIYAVLSTGSVFDETNFEMIRTKQEELRKKRVIAEAKALGLELVAVS